MSFKAFDLAHDVAQLATAVNEVVVISASLFSGTAGDPNVKKFTNITTSSVALGGYWQTVYDASPTASTSTPLLDFTFGYHSSSAYNVAGSTVSSQNEKMKVYREMASSLYGDADQTFNLNGVSTTEAFFIMVKRSLMKDELKKGAVTLQCRSGSTLITLTDTNAAASFQQTIGGDYGYLFSGSTVVGQVWYNAGILVFPAISGTWTEPTVAWSGSTTIRATLQSGTIDNAVDGLRGKVDKITVHNQTDLYSSVFFCRATNGEFNYSSNPTYVDDNKRIRVTSGSNLLQPRTYITTVGLYDANDNLLAVAKLNKPLTKSPDNEVTVAVRLDY